MYMHGPWTSSVRAHCGLSTAHCDAVNGEMVALGLARALERETAMLRARIRLLEETGDFGAANAPVWAAR